MRDKVPEMPTRNYHISNNIHIDVYATAAIKAVKIDAIAKTRAVAANEQGCFAAVEACD